jgi:hypothetical protein
VAKFYWATWHDLTPSKIDDDNPICNLKHNLKNYYVATWHYVMGYNMVANNS